MQGTSSHTLIWHKWVLCSSEGRCGTVKTEQTLRESNGKVHRKQKLRLLPLWDPTLYIDKLFILNESIWIIFIKERLNLNFPNNSSKSYKRLYWKWHFNCLNAAGVAKIVKQMLWVETVCERVSELPSTLRFDFIVFLPTVPRFHDSYLQISFMEVGTLPRFKTLIQILARWLLWHISMKTSPSHYFFISLLFRCYLASL